VRAAPAPVDPDSSDDAAHVPVLCAAVLEWLRPAPGAVIVDATVGAGGHASALLEKILPGGRLIGLDRDRDALELTGRRLERFGDAVTLRPSRLDRLSESLEKLGIERVNSVLVDLGVSSMQLDRAERGFSFSRPGPLDMRMDQGQGRAASELVAQLSEDDLADIFYRYGEERWSRRIARRIVEERARGAIERTDQLAGLVAKAIPRGAWPRGIHPATRVFQALRIAVNEELDQVEPAIRQAVEYLRPGGRLALIAFHSLEDRVVKQTLVSLAGKCTCPPRFPVCVCGAVALVKILTRKPVVASAAEVAMNPRSRSARLRVLETL